MSKASEAGKSFLAGVLAKLPESVRAQAEAVFATDGSEGALEVLGTGALAQPEINRKFDELRAKEAELTAEKAKTEALYAEQNEWWAANKPKVEGYDRIKPEYDRLKAGSGNGNGNQPSVEDLRKEMQESLSSLSRDGLGAMATMAQLGVKHLREFNEDIDYNGPQGLLTDKNLGKQLPDGRIYTIVDAYNAKYGDKIKTRAEAAEKERIDKLVDERYKERMKTEQGQPFPLRNQAPSALDVLEGTADKPENHTVDTATDLYNQLQSARG